MRFLLSALFIAGIATAAQAQGEFWNSPQAYLGQQPPGDRPQIFALKLLTQKDTFSMDRVAFSDDGKEFYYPTNTSWFSSQNAKIRYFKFESGRWQGPFLLKRTLLCTDLLDRRQVALSRRRPTGFAPRPYLAK